LLHVRFAVRRMSQLIICWLVVSTRGNYGTLLRPSG
jgi:hypothetical protein